MTIEKLLKFSVENCFPTSSEENREFIYPEVAGEIEKICADLERPGRIPITVPSTNSMEAVVQKLKKACYSQTKREILTPWERHILLSNTNNTLNNQVAFTSRERRILTSALFYQTETLQPIVENQEELAYAIDILNNGWQSGYLLRLIYSYVIHWGEISKEALQPLFTFIEDKLNSQEKIRFNPHYLGLYYGPKTVTKKILEKGLPFPSIQQLLYLPNPIIRSYFVFCCVLSFIEKISGNDIQNGMETVEDFLKETIGKIEEADISQKRSALYVTAKLVEVFAIRKSLTDGEKNKIISFAQRWVGDFKNKDSWKPLYQTRIAEKVPDVEAARKILERWANRIVLEAVFKKFTDPRRGAFWSKYVDVMDELVVRGSTAKLKSIRDIFGVGNLLNRYAFTEGREVLLIVMRIGNALITEVDLHGYAMYAYKAETVPPINKIDMNWVESNRDAYGNLMVQREGNHLWGYQGTGKLNHSDGVLTWEYVFNAWLLKMVLPLSSYPAK